jgi:hypothetical protein
MILTFELPRAGRFFGVCAVSPGLSIRASVSRSISPPSSEVSSIVLRRALTGVFLADPFAPKVSGLYLYMACSGSQAVSAVLATGGDRRC